jgi:hypothetical protein
VILRQRKWDAAFLLIFNIASYRFEEEVVTAPLEEHFPRFTLEDSEHVCLIAPTSLPVTARRSICCRTNGTPGS